MIRAMRIVVALSALIFAAGGCGPLKRWAYSGGDRDQWQKPDQVMAELELTPEEKTDLKLGMRGGAHGLFCDQCGECLVQCARGVDVPTMMRSYMYAYGYRNLRTAKDTLETVDLENPACASCDECTVTCRMNFDVKQRAIDIARLRSVPEDFIA